VQDRTVIPLIILEIVRQKWRLLMVIALLAVVNAGLSLYASGYQSPALAALQTRWSDLRRQSARAGYVDAATLYAKGTADLETVKKRIPEKREFARVLGELYEILLPLHIGV
jgi:type IV pilus assembly protein PilO